MNLSSISEYHRINHAPRCQVCIDRFSYGAEINISDNSIGLAIHRHNVNIMVFCEIIKAGIYLKLIYIIIGYAV